MLKGRWVPGGGGQRGKNWDNRNNTINKIYFKKLFVEKWENRTEKFEQLKLSSSLRELQRKVERSKYIQLKKKKKKGRKKEKKKQK